jgi:hypothetical protein
VKDMVLVRRQELSQEGGLRNKISVLNLSGIRERSPTLPTELAPNRTVKQGSSSKARPTAWSSAGRGKKFGRREKVCEGRS